ncbi:MAG: metallophosphoesterase [Phycisphaerales bacterium]|nr:metallophosphoesterase [Phycisphaerales bacterium]
MRTALISDIHSNLSALETVLADIDTKKVDRILSLGDIVGYGPDPKECVDLVAKRCDWSLMGNHDFGVLYEPTNFNASAEAAAYWTRRQLEPPSLENGAADETFDREGAVRRWDFLGQLRVRVVFGPFLCVHGSPRRPINEYIFPEDPLNSSKKIKDIFARIKPSRVCLVGHTHVPGVFTDDPDFLPASEMTDGVYAFAQQESVIVNPGSVGQPRDLDPRASYAILETGENFEPQSVEFIRLDYDIDRTVEKIKAIDDLNDWLGERLLQGR